MKIKKFIPVIGMIISLVVLSFVLSSCGSESGETSSGKGTFQPGECMVTEFNSENAVTGDGYALDYSGTASGYIGIQATSNWEKLVFQVSANGIQYNYWFDEDNQTLIIPLQYGSGNYTFNVLQNTTGDKYATIYSNTEYVELTDEFQPFIRSNSMVNYEVDSECVKEAAKLASQCDNDAELVNKVYEFVEDKIDYDHEFADSNPEMYYPDLDGTLDSGKGICFDYAALAAGMLRSQGVPAKIITGYVYLDGELYHAWNMIYLKNEGWITVEISASAENWNQVDITMDDTGDISALGEGSYTQRYVY